MSVILEFTIENDQFALGRALSGPPPMHVELERIVPTENTAMPFLWVTGEDFTSFEEKVAGHQSVVEFVALDRLEDSVLYRSEWHAHDDDLIRGITDAHGTILEAYSNGQWKFRLRFFDHEHLARFHDYCTDRGIAIHVDRTYTFTDPAEGVKRLGLSQEQREALLLGLREGYFDTPSRASLDELAEQLEISQQAISDRIRRGTKQVLSETLLP